MVGRQKTERKETGRQRSGGQRTTQKKTAQQKSLYTDSDYKSNDGMLTTIWGPSQWHFLHTMSFNYPVNPTNRDKINYRAYVLNLRNVLPCGKCRANLRVNMKKLPLNMSQMASRETFSKYIYDLHELINEMLHKKSGLTYDEVRNTYENFRSRCVIQVPKTQKKESGCTRPLYGKKAKCLLRIVPQENDTPTFAVDSKCVKKE
jgi:hypothetical protein